MERAQGAFIGDFELVERAQGSWSSWSVHREAGARGACTRGLELAKGDWSSWSVKEGLELMERSQGGWSSWGVHRGAGAHGAEGHQIYFNENISVRLGACTMEFEQ